MMRAALRAWPRFFFVAARAACVGIYLHMYLSRYMNIYLKIIIYMYNYIENIYTMIGYVQYVFSPSGASRVCCVFGTRVGALFLENEDNRQPKHMHNQPSTFK